MYDFAMLSLQTSYASYEGASNLSLTNNINMSLEPSPPMVIPYSANVPADPNLWDSNFIATSLFGTNEFLQSDIHNIACSLQCIACFLKQHSCYWRTVIVLSDHPRWMFKKNLMEFFVGLDYYLYYFTVAVLLLVYDHMSFQNIL